MFDKLYRFVVVYQFCSGRVLDGGDFDGLLRLNLLVGLVVWDVISRGYQMVIL